MFDRRRGVQRRASVTERGAWPLAGGLLLEVLTGSLALVGLMQGSAWWWALIGTAALLLALPAALRSAGLAPWQAALADVVAFVLLVQLVYERRSSAFGVIPTTASIAELRERFAAAFAAIESQGVPARSLPELIFLFVVFGGVLAILLDVLAAVVRIPAMTAVALIPVFVVAAVLQPSGVPLLALGATAGAWFLVLSVDGRRRSGSRGGQGLALGIGASVVVLALVVSATAPGFSAVWRSGSTGALSIGSSVNPLVDLSKNLREPVAVPVLRYSTTNPSPEYLQLTTLDTFNGTVWRHRPSAQTRVSASGSLSWPQGLPTHGVATSSYQTSISVDSLGSPWLPMPYLTVKLRADAKVAPSYEPLDHTVATADGLVGAHYTTTNLAVTPTLEQIDAIAAAQSGAPLAANVRRDLDLPGRVPKIITDTARRVVAAAGATNPFDDAVALQNYFQNSLNGFSYSTDTPDSIDGTSLAIVASFLQEKQGYCIHFATAMAVMARTLGIPSRIAIGYLPGSLLQANGSNFSYQVESSDLHAWPELYFAGIGWLSFEPTVSRGSAPSYTIPTVPKGNTPALPSTSSTQAAVPLPTPTAAPLAQPQSAAAATGVAQPSGVPGVFGVLAILAALASPMTVRLLRRRSRIARLRESGQPVRLAWDEIRDTARDLGLSASPAETPRALAGRIRERWRPDASLDSDLGQILALLEQAEYGPPRPRDRFYELADATQRTARELARATPAASRLRALLVPASLFGGRATAAPTSVRTLS